MKYIPKNSFIVIIAIHLFCNSIFASNSEKDNNSELYEIYSVVLDSIYLQLDDIHISGRTMEYNIKDSTGALLSLEVFLENFAILRDFHSLEALEDFYLKQKERYYFEDMFTSKTPVKIVPIDKIKSFSVNKDHPKFKNLLFFSSIGFNREKTDAILCVVHYRFTNKWIHLKKHQDKWKIFMVN